MTTRPPAAPPEPLWRQAALPLGACLALALALRLPGLNDGLWYDEIETLVEYVRRPLLAILTTFDSKNQHLFYSVLGHLSVSAFGESAAALRAPAVLLGLASLVAFYRLAATWAPRDEAWIGTAALAVSYHHVWFSQNARGYTGLLLFTLLATRAFRGLLSASVGQGREVLAYGVWMALAAYTHFTAALVGVAHALVAAAVVVARRRRGGPVPRPALVGLGAAVGLGALCYLPVLPQVVNTLLGPSPFAASTTWQSPLWLLAETARGLGRGVPGGWAALAVGLLVTGLGLWSWWRQDRVATALMILPAGVTAVVVLALGHNLWPRFFFFSAGFAVMLAVRGGFELLERVLAARGRPVARALAGLVLAASAATVPRAWGPKQDYEGAARFVDAARSPNDAVAVVDLTVYPYTRYLGRDFPVLTGLDSLIALEERHSRTWVLYTFPIRLAAVQPEIWQRLTSAYDTAAVFPGTVGDGAVVVMRSSTNHQRSQGAE